MAKIAISVHLKSEILDPQGRAVLGALGRFGLSEIVDVRQGKQFIFEFNGEVTEPQLAEVREIASTLLSNPVIEDFTIEVVK